MVFARLHLVCFSVLLLPTSTKLERKFNTGVTGPQLLHAFWDSWVSLMSVTGFGDFLMMRRVTMTHSHTCAYYVNSVDLPVAHKISAAAALHCSWLDWPTNILIPIQIGVLCDRGTAAAAAHCTQQQQLFWVDSTPLSPLHSMFPSSFLSHLSAR